MVIYQVKCLGAAINTLSSSTGGSCSEDKLKEKEERKKNALLFDAFVFLLECTHMQSLSQYDSR